MRENTAPYLWRPPVFFHAAGSIFSPLQFAAIFSAIALPDAPLRFNASNLPQALSWQEKTRNSMQAILSADLLRKCDKVREIESKTFKFNSFPGRSVIYERTLLEIISGNNKVTAFYLSPLRQNSDPVKRPCVVCLPGHCNEGVNNIIGIESDGSVRQTPGADSNDFALQCVAAGLPVLALEQLPFGTRSPFGINGPSCRLVCPAVSSIAILQNKTMLGWRCSDVAVGLDYLRQRNDIDMKRIGVMGFSGGGTAAFYASALLPSIKCAAILDAFGTFRQTILSHSHCWCNYVPGLQGLIEMSELTGLIAPRPLYIETGALDGKFPLAAAKTAFARSKEIFACFGSQENIQLDVKPHRHRFISARGAVEFLRTSL